MKTRMLMPFLAPAAAAALLLWAMASGKLTPLGGDKSLIFVRHPSGWQAMEGAPGAVHDLQIAPDGTAWASTTFRGGLTRWRNGSRASFSGVHFGTRENYLSGGFAVAGDSVWGAMAQHVIRADGKRWTSLPTSLKSPVSIAADPEQAWVLDSGGRLAHCSVARCEISDISGRVPGAHWGERVDFSRPVLARTPDQRLWIVHDGAVWVSAGTQQWNRMNLPGEPWRYAGSSGGRLWLSSQDGLTGLTSQGRPLRYSKAQIGISRAAVVESVWSSGDHLVVRTSEALMEHTAAGWRSVQLPPDLLPGQVRAAAIASTGALWIAGAQARGWTNWLAVLLLFPLSSGSLIWMMKSAFSVMAERERDQRQQATQILPQDMQTSAGPVRSLPPGTGLHLGLQALNSLCVAGLAWYALVHFWPHAPAWVFKPAIVLPMLLGSWILNRVWPSAAERANGSRKISFSSSLATMALLVYLPDLMDLLADRTGWGLAAGLPLLLIAGPVVCLAPELIAVWRVQSALNRGAYAEALQRAESFGSHGSADLLAGLRGEVLIAAGRPAEAEAILRNQLPVSYGATGAALGLCTLADALLEQGRPEEAAPLYERAIEGYANRGAPFAGLAEVHLSRKEVGKALELTTRAIETEQKRNIVMRRLNRDHLGLMWAQHAWTCALAGQRQQAESALSKAFQIADPRHKPLAAGLHFFAAMTCSALADPQRARDHLRKASELDPQGRWGIRARAAKPGEV